MLDPLSDLEDLTTSEKTFVPTMRPLTFETKSSSISNLATTVVDQALPLSRIIHTTDIHDGHPYVQDHLSKTHGDLVDNSILDWASDGIENNISSESESTKSDSEIAYIIKKVSITTKGKINDDLRASRASKPTSKKTNGVDLSLPPLENIADCVNDMICKGLSCGLEGALNHLDHRILRIGTMFSGTESPLVAMNLISECPERSGQSSLRVKHAFSCEIEEFKQAFIERNFQPGVMFRDA